MVFRDGAGVDSAVNRSGAVKADQGGCQAHFSSCAVLHGRMSRDAGGDPHSGLGGLLRGGWRIFHAHFVPKLA